MFSVFDRKGRGWTLKYRDGSGRVVFKALKATSRREARKEARAISGAMLDRPVEVMRMEIQELFEKWQGWAEINGRSEATLRLTRWAFEALSKQGVRYVGEETPQKIQEMIGYLHNGLGWNATSVNHVIHRLHAAYARMLRQGVIDVNPWQGVELLRPAEREARMLSEEEVGRLLAGVLDHRVRTQSWDLSTVVHLGLFAGLRRGEILAAKWYWMDWDNRLLRVGICEEEDRPEGRWVPKSRKERSVPMCGQLCEYLRQLEAVTRITGGGIDRDGYLVAPGKKEWLDPVRLRWNFKRELTDLFAAVQLSWATTHTLRHTFAGTLVSRGVDIYKVSRWLGHASVRETERYAHLTPGGSDSVTEAFKMFEARPSLSATGTP